MLHFSETAIQAPPLASAIVYHLPPVALSTEGELQPPRDYKQEVGSRQTAEIGPSPAMVAVVKDETPKGSQPSVARPAVGRGHRVVIDGAVDEVGPQQANVTLYYGERANRFVLPTAFLAEAGAAYSGALFEIVLKEAGGFHVYDIVHAADRERAARAQAAKPDLSFLDGPHEAKNASPR